MAPPWSVRLRRRAFERVGVALARSPSGPGFTDASLGLALSHSAQRWGALALELERHRPLSGPLMQALARLLGAAALELPFLALGADRDTEEQVRLAVAELTEHSLVALGCLVGLLRGATPVAFPTEELVATLRICTALALEDAPHVVQRRALDLLAIAVVVLRSRGSEALPYLEELGRRCQIHAMAGETPLPLRRRALSLFMRCASAHDRARFLTPSRLQALPGTLAAAALQGLGPNWPRQEPSLLPAALGLPSVQARQALVENLPRDEVAALTQLSTRDPSERVRALAMVALATYPRLRTSAKRRLLRALRSESELVQRNVLSALESLAERPLDANTRRALESMVEVGSPRVARRAALLLRGQPGEALLPPSPRRVLTTLLADRNDTSHLAEVTLSVCAPRALGQRLLTLATLVFRLEELQRCHERAERAPQQLDDYLRALSACGLRLECRAARGVGRVPRYLVEACLPSEADTHARSAELPPFGAASLPYEAGSAASALGLAEVSPGRFAWLAWGLLLMLLLHSARRQRQLARFNEQVGLRIRILIAADDVNSVPLGDSVSALLAAALHDQHFGVLFQLGPARWHAAPRCGRVRSLRASSVGLAQKPELERQVIIELASVLPQVGKGANDLNVWVNATHPGQEVRLASSQATASDPSLAAELLSEECLGALVELPSSAIATLLAVFDRLDLSGEDGLSAAQSYHDYLLADPSGASR